MDLALSVLADVSYWALTLYLWMIIVAILLTWVAPDPRNPLVRFLNRMTGPLWNFMARVLPARWALFASYAALLVVMFGIEFVPGVLSTFSSLAGGRIGVDGLFAPLAGFFLRGIAVVVYNFCYFLILCLVVWFVLTLVSPSVHNPVVRSVYFLVDPIITPVQRLLPRMRFDLSPLIAAAVLLLVNTFLVGGLMRYATSLIFIPANVQLPIQHM